MIKSIYLIIFTVVAIVGCTSNNNEVVSADIMVVQDNDLKNKDTENLDKLIVDNVKNDRVLKSQVIYFSLDHVNINQEYKEALHTHASNLINSPSLSITIEGHADNRGSSKYNMNLGERRALAVANYLKGLGVRDEQVFIVSYGEDKPISIEDNEVAHSRNRRVIIFY